MDEGLALLELWNERNHPLSAARPRRRWVVAFSHGLDKARDMGWEIVDSDRDEGRIEGTDTTFWFGFKDDVVIRIAEDPSGTRVDVRSVSRVGRSDVGTNAARIREFLERLAAARG